MMAEILSNYNLEKQFEELMRKVAIARENLFVKKQYQEVPR